MFKLASIAVATLALTTAPALAKDGSWQVGNDQIHLTYSHIDMQTSAGRAQMLTLVEKAAGKLCADRVLLADRQACIGSAIATAAAKDQTHGLALAVTERRETALAAR
jgi:UrcA family protein